MKKTLIYIFLLLFVFLNTTAYVFGPDRPPGIPNNAVCMIVPTSVLCEITGFTMQGGINMSNYNILNINYISANNWSNVTIRQSQIIDLNLSGFNLTLISSNNCSVEGSCDLVTYDTELQNGTIVRTWNQSWVKSIFTNSTNITFDFTTGSFSYFGPVGTGGTGYNNCSVEGSCSLITYDTELDNSTILRVGIKLGNTTAEIWGVVNNGSFIPVGTKLGNTTAEIWGVVNNGTFASIEYVINTNISMKNYVDNNFITIGTKLGNTTDEIWGVVNNGSFIPAGTKLGNTSDEIKGLFSNSSNITFDYATGSFYYNGTFPSGTGYNNCSVEGSCSLITYDTELDNSTIIRNYNTSWIKTNQAYWNGTDVQFLNVNITTDLICEGNATFTGQFETECLHCDEGVTYLHSNVFSEGNITAPNIEIMESLIVYGNSTCSGTANACGDAMFIGNPFLCGLTINTGQRGCRWSFISGTCIGTATPCSEMSTTTCEEQHTCTLTTSNTGFIIDSMGLSGNFSIITGGNITANTFFGRWNGSSDYVPYIGATKNVDLGKYNITINGTIKFPESGGISDLMFVNTPYADGFALQYWYDFELVNDDWIVFRKTDGNDDRPDGGIAFMMTNASGYNWTVLKLDGYGNANFTDTKIYTTNIITANTILSTLNGTWNGSIDYYTKTIFDSILNNNSLIRSWNITWIQSNQAQNCSVTDSCPNILYINQANKNCSVEGSCSLITYDTELQNNTIIRSWNQSWVKSIFTNSTNISFDFTTGSFSYFGPTGSGSDSTGSWINNSIETNTTLNVNIGGNLTVGTGNISFEFIDAGTDFYFNYSSDGSIIFFAGGNEIGRFEK